MGDRTCDSGARLLPPQWPGSLPQSPGSSGTVIELVPLESLGSQFPFLLQSPVCSLLSHRFMTLGSSPRIIISCPFQREGSLLSVTLDGSAVTGQELRGGLG